MPRWVGGTEGKQSCPAEFRGLVNHQGTSEKFKCQVWKTDGSRQSRMRCSCDIIQRWAIKVCGSDDMQYALCQIKGYLSGIRKAWRGRHPDQHVWGYGRKLFQLQVRAEDARRTPSSGFVIRFIHIFHQRPTECPSLKEVETHSKSCLTLLCTNNSLLATQMCSILTPASRSLEWSQRRLILNPSIPQAFPGLHVTKARGGCHPALSGGRVQAPHSARLGGPGLPAVFDGGPGDVAGWPPFTHEDVRAYSDSRGIARQGAKTNTLRLLLFSCVSGITGRLPIICFILLKAPKPHWFLLTWSESLGVSC